LRAATAGAERDASADVFPWDAAMAAGFGLLRLSPHDFWAMTPREFAAAITPFGVAAKTAPNRAELAALMARYPDHK
jgi:uncharacterized phage protein (TIGR02216 family)